MLLLLLLLLVLAAGGRDVHEELFGRGLSEETLAAQSARHPSSSVEDLAALFERERDLVRRLETMLLAEGSLDEKGRAAAKRFLRAVDYMDNFNMSALEYASHPVNAFRLLKRSATLAPGLAGAVADATAVPAADFDRGAAFGLLNLQAFHGLDPAGLVSDGAVSDPATGASFPAASAAGLTPSDAALVSARARAVWRLDASVEWAEAAAAAAAPGSRARRRLERAAGEARRFHDEFVLSHGFSNVRHPAGEEVAVVYTARSLYDRSLSRGNAAYQRHAAARDVAEYSARMFDNLADPDDPRNAGQDRDELPFKLTYYLDEVTRRLCCGEEGLRPPELDKDLRCLLLHRNNPYFRLRPFKYETLHSTPHVGLLHGFASAAETALFRDRARGRMKSTPLTVQNADEGYTRLRTSKVAYLNERGDPAAAAVSDRLAAAMGFAGVYGEPYASENYQVMNYGLGGAITGHLDSVGDAGDAAPTEADGGTGGHRLATFMLYLTTVEAGGRTVFPQVALSVPPVEGDALFWFNLDSVARYDTRNFHLGCPVLFGNKWIANKWVKNHAQMFTHPCRADRGPFAPFSNG